MSIYLVSGKLGAGKTLACVGVIRDALLDGRKVATNLDLNLDKMLPGRIGKKSPVHCVRIPDKPTVADLDHLGCGNEEMDERKKEYEQYSNRVQSLAQSQLESALKGEFTLKSAKEAVKNAAIQFIAEEATKRLATYIENLVFQKATAATASAESIAQAEVTGTGIAAAMASAAALQSVATMGAADVAGSAGLSSTIALAQGYAMAANGTDFAPGGTTIVGERGPELVNLPRGSEVVPNHALKAWTGSNSTSTTTTHNTYVIKETVDPRALSKAISRAKSYSEVSRARGSI